MENGMKERIKQVAVGLFDRQGYHGATIRQIAEGAGCSLPTVYYYFKSKKDLFREIILGDYFQLLQRHTQKVTDPDPLEYYTGYISALESLSEEEKRVFRLGLKVGLRFDGDEELYEAVDAWEKRQIAWHFQKVMPVLGNVDNWSVIIRVLLQVLENMTLAIVLKGQEFSEDAIRENLQLVLEKGGYAPSL